MELVQTDQTISDAAVLRVAICDQCERRFVAALEVEGNSDTMPLGRHDFLCQHQLHTALHDLMIRRERAVLGERFLLDNRPDLFWNMIRHFGNYKLALAAFKRWREDGFAN